MKKRIINRLWNGVASLRDYEVEQAIVDGGVILELKGTKETMALTVDDLQKGFQITRASHQSLFNKEQTYKLIDFTWKKNKKDNSQIGLQI